MRSRNKMQGKRGHVIPDDLAYMKNSMISPNKTVNAVKAEVSAVQCSLWKQQQRRAQLKNPKRLRIGCTVEKLILKNKHFVLKHVETELPTLNSYPALLWVPECLFFTTLFQPFPTVGTEGFWHHKPHRMQSASFKNIVSENGLCAFLRGLSVLILSQY